MARGAGARCKSQPTRSASLAARRPRVLEELRREPARIREREEMAAGDFFHVETQSFFRDASLKVARKEAVVFADDDLRRNVRPALEAARLSENDFRFFALERRALLRNVGWHVVKKVFL